MKFIYSYTKLLFFKGRLDVGPAVKSMVFFCWIDDSLATSRLLFQTTKQTTATKNTPRTVLTMMSSVR